MKLRGNAPEYPESARNAHLEGTVILHLLIGADGLVKNVKLVRGVSDLNFAAMDAAKTWVYSPGLSNKKPVAVWIEEQIHFPPQR